MGKLIICGSGNLLYKCIKEVTKKNDILKVYCNKTNNEIDYKIKNLLIKKKISYSYRPINKYLKSFVLRQSEKYHISLISLQYRNILNERIINLFKNKVYNIHFSYLPKNRGCYPIAHSFLDGSNYSGVTLHQINKGIDEGDIIKQIKLDLSKFKSAKELYEKKIKIGVYLYNYFINNLNNFSYKKQDNTKATYYSKDSLDFSNSYINWNKKFHEILNFLKAMNFPPYQYPKLRYIRLNFDIIDFELKKYKKFNFPGYSLRKKGYFYVNCIDAAIKIKIEKKINKFIKNKNNLIFYI